MNDSRWYYGVFLVMGLEIIGFGLIAVAGFGETGPAQIGTGLVGALVVLVSLLLLPVFALCLYLDARSVRDGTESWDPNPLLWAGGAVVVQLVGIAAGVSLYLFVGTFYLFRRFRSSPAAVADEDAWAEQEAQWKDEDASAGED